MQRHAIIALLAVAVGVSACAYYDDYGDSFGSRGGSLHGDYMYAGAAYNRDSWDDGRMRVGGSGADILDPWLALTSEGRDILARGFNAGPDGRVSAEMAGRANVWFRRYADSDRNMRLTDEEIRLALAHAAREGDRIGY